MLLLQVLKYHLSQRTWNTTYEGGIGSFCTFLMVIASIQVRLSVGVMLAEIVLLNSASAFTDF
jgi:DNA polymerase sigma